MVTLLNVHRFGATAVLTSLMLVTGCRTASVNPASSSGGTPPFFRSFDRAPRSNDYDDGAYQSPSPEPMPPAILPAPGYSEPDVPPPPSAKKSRWNLAPSVFKFQSKTRQNSEVHQTGAKVNREFSSILGKERSIAPLLHDQSGDLVEETVQSRFSAAPTGPALSSPASFESGMSNAARFRLKPQVSRDANPIPPSAPLWNEKAGSTVTGEMPLLLPPRF